MEHFTDLSKELNALIDRQTKKAHGIFFTPRTYRQQVLESVSSLSARNPLSVLEPSFGSGEFIMDTLVMFPKAHITGVELNPVMYDKVNQKLGSYIPHALTLMNADFIDFETDIKYDLIIGNPPYVVKRNTPPQFKNISSGRPNIYCWFIYKCIQMLNDDGILAFVIPNSFFNTSYYDLLRTYVVQQCDIRDIIEFDTKKSDFKETEQTTIGFIVQKRSPGSPPLNTYVVKHGQRIIFNTHYGYIRTMLSSHPNLESLGVSVKTGSIVWNQNKQHLTDDAHEGTLLLYSSNIKQGKFSALTSTNNEKKQYIKCNKPTFEGPVILINRGYGNTTYVPTMMFIDDGETVHGFKKFYAENHVNVIFPKNIESKPKMKQIYDYLCSDKNKDYIAKYTGNGALSKSEIETMLPIVI
jgi:adenine-specific DNA-methyltransferase